MVTWSFPPVLIGSSQIAEGLARQFAAEEMTIAAERWPGLPNSEWNDEGGTKPQLFIIHKQWPWRFKKTIRLLLLPFVLWRLNRVFCRSKSQQIFAMFPNEYYLFLSWLIARWHRVPLISYFHNTYLENRRGVKRIFAKWLQPKIFRDSAIVFVMSEGMREVLAAKHPTTEFVPLVHTYEVAPPPLERVPVPNRALNLAFMGSLNRSNSEAFSRIGAVLAHFPECSFTTYSGNRPEDFAAIGASCKNVHHTRVAFDQVVEALRKHDVLFFPHGFEGGLNEIEYATIFPTRTTPYLLSGVPVVAHSPPNAFLTKWLRSHDCAEVVDVPDESALVAAFERLIDNPQRCQQLSKNALRASRTFFAPVVVNELRRRLNSVAI